MFQIIESIVKLALLIFNIFKPEMRIEGQIRYRPQISPQYTRDCINFEGREFTPGSDEDGFNYTFDRSQGTEFPEVIRNIHYAQMDITLKANKLTTFNKIRLRVNEVEKIEDGTLLFKTPQGAQYPEEIVFDLRNAKPGRAYEAQCVSEDGNSLETISDIKYYKKNEGEIDKFKAHILMAEGTRVTFDIEFTSINTSIAYKVVNTRKNTVNDTEFELISSPDPTLIASFVPRPVSRNGINTGMFWSPYDKSLRHGGLFQELEIQ